ncbi:hypothetical protein D3C76_1698220 [compost metagenome]
MEGTDREAVPDPCARINTGIRGRTLRFSLYMFDRPAFQFSPIDFYVAGKFGGDVFE